MYVGGTFFLCGVYFNNIIGDILGSQKEVNIKKVKKWSIVLHRHCCSCLKHVNTKSPEIYLKLSYSTLYLNFWSMHKN